MDMTRDAEREFVLLKDAHGGVHLYGDLVTDNSECRIEGIAAGITHDNYRSFRPFELAGTSTKRGAVWIDRIFSVSPTVFSEESRPATVRLKALAVYWGAFDPRATLIERAVVSLEQLPQLSPEKLQQEAFSPEGDAFVSRSQMDISSAILFSNDEFAVSVDYLATLGKAVSYEQILSISFSAPASHKRANELLDRVLTLISVLTVSSVCTPLTRYFMSEKSAYQWTGTGAVDDIHNVWEWLPQPGKSIEVLRQMLPSWMQNVDDALALNPVKVFLTAVHGKMHLESEFLAYCQCFEELNKRRHPLFRILPEEEFDAKVLTPLRTAIDDLKNNGVNSDKRRRILKQVTDANNPSLKDRIRKALGQDPLWRADVHGAIGDIFERIEDRRNELSHGNPAGSIFDESEMHAFQIEREFIFLHTLIEILFLGGLTEQQVHELVVRCAAASNVLWLVNTRT